MTNENVRDPRLAEMVGKPLRDARLTAGLQGKDVAVAARLTQARVTNIEKGNARPRPEEVEKWADAVGADTQTRQRLLEALDAYSVWRAQFDLRISYGVAGDEASYTTTFKGTKEVRTFAAAEIPGYLQTEQYARQVLANTATDTPDDEREEAVKARLDRAQNLGRRGKKFQVVLAEPALRWMLTEPNVMRLQLAHLLTLVGQDGLDLRVLPAGMPIRTPARTGFTIHDRKFVVVDMFGGAVTFQQREPERYSRIMDEIQDQAVSGDSAHDLISAAMNALPAR
jgi:transcriptional regulator with XRE-family HTH domain